MPRTESYNEEVSKKLKNPKYAQNFIEGLMEGDEGLSAEDAIRHTIEIMGIKEFAKLAKIETPRVVEFTKKKRNFKPETIDLLLRPFRMRTKMILERA